MDDKLHLLKIKYKDGSTSTFNYGEQYTSNSGGGFYVSNQVIQNNFQVGDKIKQGDVVTYNKEYFKADPYTKQVDWKLGCSANIVLMEGDTTIEDSSTITKTLSDKLAFAPTHVRTITITHDTNIHKILSIGTKVTNIDPLLTFDNSAISDTFNTNMDEETINLLNKLNHKTPKAKFAGTLVKIEALYNSPIDEMSSSLAIVVKRAIKDKNQQAKFSQNTINSDDYLKSNPIIDTDRIGLIEFTPGTVILKFYIKQDIGVNAGDKLVFGTSLKSVVTKVLPESIEVEDGSVQIDGMMSALGAANRIVMSPILIGATTRVLEKIEEDILNMYFDK